MDGPEVETLIHRCIDPMLAAGADHIVLGCTHYPFLLPVMRRIAGPTVRIIDPAPSVARHLIYVMVQEHLLSEAEATRALSKVIELAEAADRGVTDAGIPECPRIELISSGDPLPLQRIFGKIFRAKAANSLEMP